METTERTTDRQPAEYNHHPSLPAGTMSSYLDMSDTGLDHSQSALSFNTSLEGDFWSASGANAGGASANGQTIQNGGQTDLFQEDMFFDQQQQTQQQHIPPQQQMQQQMLQSSVYHPQQSAHHNKPSPQHIPAQAHQVSGPPAHLFATPFSPFAHAAFEVENDLNGVNPSSNLFLSHQPQQPSASPTALARGVTGESMLGFNNALHIGKMAPMDVGAQQSQYDSLIDQEESGANAASTSRAPRATKATAGAAAATTNRKRARGPTGAAQQTTFADADVIDLNPDDEMRNLDASTFNTGLQQVARSVAGQSTGSDSPTNFSEVPTMEKKQKHQLTDRQRRAKIKESMDALKALVPLEPNQKADQATIVASSVTLVQNLKDEVAELRARLQAMEFNAVKEASKLDAKRSQIRGAQGMQPNHPALSNSPFTSMMASLNGAGVSMLERQEELTRLTAHIRQHDVVLHPSSPATSSTSSDPALAPHVVDTPNMAATPACFVRLEALWRNVEHPLVDLRRRVAALPRDEHGTPMLCFLDLVPFLDASAWETHSGVYAWLLQVTATELTDLRLKVLVDHQEEEEENGESSRAVTLHRLLCVLTNIESAVVSTDHNGTIEVIYVGQTWRTCQVRYRVHSDSSTVHHYLREIGIGKFHRGLMAGDVAGVLSNADCFGFEGDLAAILSRPACVDDQRRYYAHDGVLRLELNRMPLGMSYAAWMGHQTRNPLLMSQNEWYMRSELDTVVGTCTELFERSISVMNYEKVRLTFCEYLNVAHGFSGTITCMEFANWMRDHIKRCMMEPRRANWVDVLAHLLFFGYNPWDNVRCRSNDWSLKTIWRSAEMQAWLDEKDFLDASEQECRVDTERSRMQDAFHGLTASGSGLVAPLQTRYAELWATLSADEASSRVRAGYAQLRMLGNVQAGRPWFADCAVKDGYYACSKCGAPMKLGGPTQAGDLRAHQSTATCAREVRRRLGLTL
jgi:hypothetical protein